MSRPIRSPSIDSKSFIVDPGSFEFDSSFTTSDSESFVEFNADEDTDEAESNSRVHPGTSSSIGFGEPQTNHLKYQTPLSNSAPSYDSKLKLQHQKRQRQLKKRGNGNNHSSQNGANSTSSTPGGPLSFNAIEYLIASLNNSLSAIELDRSVVLQSKVSGELNSTSIELLKMMDELQEKIEDHAERYKRVKKTVIPELTSNLAKSEKLVNSLTRSMKSKFPVEYSKSKDKVLNRITAEEEDLYV